MIRKWYEVTCDYEECGCAIGHYRADTMRDVVEQAKMYDHPVIKYIAGKRQPYIFCNEECFERWAKSHRYDPVLNKCREMKGR